MKLKLPGLWPALALCGCALDPPPPANANHAPTARLVLPQITVAGEPAAIDATASSDDDVIDGQADQETLAFVFSFGDATPEADDVDGAFAHAWAAAGTFTLSVKVTDAHALEAKAEATIVVVDGAAEDCSCAAPCLDEGICSARGCLLFASSVDEDADVADEILCD